MLNPDEDPLRKDKAPAPGAINYALSIPTIGSGSPSTATASIAENGLTVNTPNYAAMQKANGGVDSATEREKFSLENNLKSFEDKGGGIIRGVGNDGKVMITNVGTSGVTDPTKPLPVANSIDMKASNASMARANAIRQQMIDSAVSENGIAGSGVFNLGTDVERDNEEKTRRWRQDALIAMAQRNPAAGALAAELARGNSGRDIEAMRQAGVSDGHNVQMRGQDLNYAASVAQHGLTARSQDLNAARDDQRIGIERSRLSLAEADQLRAGEKFALDKRILQGQLADSEAVRAARSELASAISSGDQAKIAAAKEKATAAGIRFDKPNNEFTAVTDNMGMNITRTNKDTGAVDIIDGKTGKIKSSIPAPGQRQSVSIDAFAAQIRAKNPGQTITDEQIAAAYKSQFGVN